MNLGTLTVVLAAKIREYVADLDKAATATEVNAVRIARADASMTQAAKQVATGQADVADTAAQVATRMGPMGGAVAAAAAVVAGYALVSYKAAQENTALVRAMALSGNQAGVTAGQLQSMAAAAGQVVATHGQSAQAIGAMVSNGKVAAVNLQALTVTALNASRTLGIGVEDTVKRYEELGEAPTKASRKLNEAMGYLNAETYRRIQALEEMGKKDEAAALAQLSYAKGLDDAAKKVEASLGYVQKAWRWVGEAAAGAWDKFLGLGRKDEVQDNLADLRTKLAAKERELRAGFATTGGGAAVGMRGMSDDRRSALQAEADALSEQIRLLGRAGATAAQNAANSVAYQKESIEWAKKAEEAGYRLLTNEQKRAKAIDEINSKWRMGHMDDAERRTLIADAEKQFADQVRKGNDGQRERMALLREQQKGLDDLIKSILEREKAEQAAELATLKAYNDVLDARYKATDAVEKELDRQLSLNAAMGLGKEAVADLEAAKLEDTASSKERLAVLADEIDWSGRMGDAYRDEAAALYALAKAKRDGAKKEAGLDADKSLAKRVADAAKEAERVAQKIEDSLTDALMRGFESGKGFAANLADTVVNMFKTMVLRPIVSAVVNPVAGAITGSLGLTGTANAASGAGNLLGVGGLYSSFATSGVGSALGLSVPMVDVLGTGAAGNIMSGLGSSVGSAIPWIGGILAIGSLLKSLDDSGTFHTGGASTYSAATGASNINSMTLGTAAVVDSSKTQAMTSGMVQSIVGILDSTAMTFGKQAGYSAATAFADDSSRDNSWGALVISKGGQTLLDWAATQSDRWAPKTFADGDAGAQQYAAAVAADVRNLLLEQTPEWADTMLRALGDAPSIEQLAATVQQINATQAALVGMGRASEAFAAMGEQAAATLIAAMGGAEAAASNLAAYYVNFYSESERTGIATSVLTEQLAALGVAMPASREGLRAMIDAAVAAGNPKLAASLINLSDEFAALVPATQDAAAAVARLSADIAGSYSDAYTEYADSVRATRALATEQAQAYASLLADARDFLGGVSDTVKEWLDSRNATTGNPTANLASSQAAFQRQLALAQGGDRDALGSITQYADRLISAGEQRLGYLQGQQLIASVVSQVKNLPGQVSAEQLIVNAINSTGSATVGAVSGLANNALTTELTVTARSEILKTISYVADTDRLPDELKQLALDTTSALRKTISYVVGIDLPDDVKQLALLGTSSVNKTIVLVAQSTLTSALQTLALQATQTVGKTIDLVARSALTVEEQSLALLTSTGVTKTIAMVSSSTLTDEQKRLALSGSDSVTKTIGLTATSTLSAEERGLILLNSGSIARAIDVAAGRMDTDALRVLMASSDVVRRTVDAAGGNLTADQRLLLDGSTNLAKMIEVGVDSTAINAFLNTLKSLPPISIPFVGTFNVGSVLQHASTGGNADMSRLASISAYVNTLDWGADKIGSTRALYATAQAYGVSQADIAAATGYNLADIRSLFEGAGIPAFDVGTNYVPRDMVALVHEGESIVPKAYNPAAGGSMDVAAVGRGMYAMAAEMRALRQDNDRLYRLLGDVKTNTGAGTRELSRIRTEGLAVHGPDEGDPVPPVKTLVVTS